MKATRKRYACTQCGHVITQTTNHYGSTWSWGRVNTCPKCPPFRKYPEFGGATVWECLDAPTSPTESKAATLAVLHDALTRRGDALKREYKALCDYDAVKGKRTNPWRRSILPYLIYQVGFKARAIAARMVETCRVSA